MQEQESSAIASKHKLDLENVPVAELLYQYRKAAEGTSNPKPKQANKSHDVMHLYYKQLCQTDHGRNGITALLKDKSPHVRG
jgi:hypothetical protein